MARSEAPRAEPNAELGSVEGVLNRQHEREFSGGADIDAMIALARHCRTSHSHWADLPVETGSCRAAARVMYESAGFEVAQHLLVYRKDL